jgi:hypothetical protein
MSTITQPPISSHIAFSLRLRRLETLLAGSPQGVVEDTVGLNLHDGSVNGVQRRVTELQENLERIPTTQGQESLRRFVTHC